MSGSVNSKQLAVNSWKDVPHLFIGFKIKTHVGDIEKLLGIDGQSAFVIGDEYGELLLSKLDKCTLIARPISDMSDEELNEVFKDYGFDYELTSVKWNEEGYFTIKTGTGNPSFIQYLYTDKFRFQLVLNLLQKGVYAFDQKHFQNGDVIARYENKDTESLNTQNSTLNTAKP